MGLRPWPESPEVTIVSTGEWCMAVELVGIETCYRHEEKIPPRFKPCPYAAAAAATVVVAAKITTLFRRIL